MVEAHENECYSAIRQQRQISQIRKLWSRRKLGRRVNYMNSSISPPFSSPSPFPKTAQFPIFHTPAQTFLDASWQNLTTEIDNHCATQHANQIILAYKTLINRLYAHSILLTDWLSRLNGSRLPSPKPAPPPNTFIYCESGRHCSFVFRLGF